MAEPNLESKKDKFVPLEPFVHQVGGHSSMMKFDEVSVCKPLIPREHRFYEELPSEMRPFIPEYRGIVYVSFQEDDEGYIHLIAHPDKRALERGNSSGSDDSEEDVIASPQRRSRRISCVESVEKAPHRVRLRSGKVELVDTRKEGMFEADDMPEQSADSPLLWSGNRQEHHLNISAGRSKLNGSGANPWSLHCHKLQLSKMKESRTSKKIHKFIVLENVAYRFSYPCILDLKMGTRQHGDDTPSEKRDRHIAKVEKSTSKTLGLRVCGMQVYQRNSGRFICRNKYYGLKLSEEGVRRELTNFIHNGQWFREELLEPLLQKLYRLYKVIEKQQSFRYYSSSLLLMYEGDEDSNSADEQLKSTCGADGEVSRSKAEMPPLKRSHSSNRNQRSGKVDVRMIDFAHTTHSGFSGDRVRTGPDKGYLFGIKNLIRLLEEIRDKCREGSTRDEAVKCSQESSLAACGT